MRMHLNGNRVRCFFFIIIQLSFMLLSEIEIRNYLVWKKHIVLALAVCACPDSIRIFEFERSEKKVSIVEC